ncbi:hypothetical protein [Aeromonas salmonicida]|uniref:Uncharacterized protein n=1 Tax=Aeromonas salmonicida TaxID=645 RepID=A0AAX1PKR1_AERSA|nr:hypothetical protein [Aeromonas salmonicida]RAJ06376.1 hypothetical protein DEU50_104157 [Aeromonas salmonicida]
MSKAADNMSGQIAAHEDKIRALIAGEVKSRFTESELSFSMGFLYGLRSTLDYTDMADITDHERHNLIIELKRAISIIGSVADAERKRRDQLPKGGFINIIKRLFS